MDAEDARQCAAPSHVRLGFRGGLQVLAKPGHAGHTGRRRYPCAYALGLPYKITLTGQQARRQRHSRTAPALVKEADSAADASPFALAFRGHNDGVGPWQRAVYTGARKPVTNYGPNFSFWPTWRRICAGSPPDGKTAFA